MMKKAQRKLAAVASLDVVGYSRMMGEDEPGTLAILQSHRSELIDPVIGKHGGRIVKTMGDGLLLEFPSAINAVQCALEVQQGMRERNERFDEKQRIIFRIGVNLGDIIIEGDDIFGDGVNLAARLQEAAKPGGVCIAGVVYEQIAGRTEQQFDDLGFRKLKNISKPVRIYALRAPDTESNKNTPSGWPYLTAAKEEQPVTSGGCLCGRVRYEIWGEPAGRGYCHCRFCQLALGAPLNAWAAYEESLIRFVGDAPKIYKSSPIAERGFCGNCGTSLYTDLRGFDGLRYYSIRLATLDNPEDFPPMLHFGVESKLPWLDIDDDLPRICTEEDPGVAGRWTAVGQPKSGPVLGTAVERLHSDLKDRKP